MHKNSNRIKMFSLVSFIGLLFVLGFFSATKVLAVNQEYGDNPDSNSGYQIVPKCTGEIITSVNDSTHKGQIIGRECGWADLLNLIRNIMGFLLYLTASLAVLAFCYAGFLYLTAFGEMGKIEKAHSVFTNVIMGFVFVFLAWLLVATILKTLGVQQAFSLLNLNGIQIFNTK